MKRSTQVTVYILAALLIAALLVLSNIVRRNAPVRSVKVAIDYGGGDTLVSSTALSQWLTRQMPALLGSRVKEVDDRAVEQTLARNPYIESCRVNISVGGDINVNAHQRIPILHMFYIGREFYMDEKGGYLPLSGESIADVMVGNGFFNVALPKVMDSLSLRQMEKNRNFRLKSLYTVAEYLHQHPDYGILFDQIYMNEGGDVCLVPKAGNHLVVIGDANHLDRKFYDLIAFYREGCSKVGWDTYEQISVKYKGQVIGKRRQQGT